MSIPTSKEKNLKSIACISGTSRPNNYTIKVLDVVADEIITEPQDLTRATRLGEGNPK